MFLFSPLCNSDLISSNADEIVEKLSASGFEVLALAMTKINEN